MKRPFRLLSILLIVVILLVSLAPTALALDKPGRLKIMSAVVQIWWIVDTPEGLRGAGMGSGTLITPDGLILTNHHVAVPDQENIKYLGVALTTRSDQPPQPAYLATIVADDPYLDLAVLRVTHDLNKRPVNAADVKLPFVPVGDSDSVDVGDELNIFGYPGIGGATVTFTKGVVSGFTLDQMITGRAWVKTDTTIAGGNSGGTAVDETGMLVGIPTQMGAGDADTYVDCRPLADTNRDGKLDEADSCVPGGGFLNALRPVNLAKPLIEAARQGLAYVGRGSQSSGTQAPTPTGQARISNLQFSTGVTTSDQPTSLVSSLPSGSRSLYLFFDYENMADGTPWEVRVIRDGKDLSDIGMSSHPWAGGPAGNWWVGWGDTAFPDGAYTFRILVNGQKLGEASLKIGGQAQRSPTFANIVFSQEYNIDGTPTEPSRLFPEGIQRLYWFFDYENMTAKTPWTYTWLYNGKVADTGTLAWDGEAKGQMRMTLTSDKGLPAGTWRLELAIQGQPAAWGDFVVSGQQGGVRFGPPIFARGMDQKTGQPIDPRTSFPSGTQVFYVFSDYSGMKDGLNCITRLYLNGQMVLDNPFVWGSDVSTGSGESGTWSNVIYATGGRALPDGEYKQELIVEGQVVLSGTVAVGASAAPTPTPAPTPAADSIGISGVISDANTGRPIPGAFFIVLQPGITVASFQWTDAEVYAMTQADRQGAYTLPKRLLRGECYSLIVGAEGYSPVTEDDVCIGPKAAAEADLPIQLKPR